MRREVMAGEQSALEMLMDIFDWLDGLEPQPTFARGSVTQRSNSGIFRTDN
jgi:hypothetical protein